jgi:hypothetical protein
VRAFLLPLLVFSLTSLSLLVMHPVMHQRRRFLRLAAAFDYRGRL